MLAPHLLCVRDVALSYETSEGRFVAVDGESYDDVQLMLGRVHEAGLVGAQWRARWAAVSSPTSTVI